MNIIVYGIEWIMLAMNRLAVQRVLPNDNVYPFQKSEEAIEFAQSNKVDIAFIDVYICRDKALELAEKLQSINPKINIFLCHGIFDIPLEAQGFDCCDYLTDPLSDETVKKALDTLKYPIE